MSYFYLLHLASPQGQYTIQGVLEWGDGVTREEVFVKLFEDACRKHKLPVQGTGVTFFCLEPNQQHAGK